MRYSRTNPEGIESFLGGSFRSSLLGSTMKGNIFAIFSEINREKFERIYMNLLEMDVSKNEIISALREPNIQYLENMSEEYILNFLFERLSGNKRNNEEEEEKSFENYKSHGEKNDISISILLGNSNDDINSIAFLHDDLEKEMSKQRLGIYSSPKFKMKLDNTFECPVCLCQVTNFFDIPKCLHRFCEECLFLYLKNIIYTQAINLDDIKCPQEKCLNCFNSDFIEMIIAREEALLEKYLKFIKRNKILRNPKIRECIRPNCEEYITKKFLTNQMKCKCGQIICFKCGYEWHGFRKCLDHSEERFFNYQRKKNLKKCPLCRINIEKNEGCNHMTCIKCKFEFCWICNEEWNKTTGYCPNGCLKFPEYGLNFINLDYLQPDNPLISLNIWEQAFYIILQIIGIFIVPYFLIFRTFCYYIFYLSWVGTFFAAVNVFKNLSIKSSKLLKKSIFLFPLVLIIFCLMILIVMLSFVCNMILMDVVSMQLQFTVWMVSFYKKKSCFFIFKFNYKNMMPVIISAFNHNNYVSGISKCKNFLGYLIFIIYYESMIYFVFLIEQSIQRKLEVY